jgi:hypothetical protein
MLKPYSKADIYFQHRNEIGGEGRNSKTYVAHDSQLNAEIVINALPQDADGGVV